VKVEAILFANRAAVDGNLLAVEGGGWEHYDVALFPATVSGYVAGIVALDESQHGSLPSMMLETFDDAGHVEGARASTIAFGTRPETTQGVPYRVAFAIPFMTAARGPTVVKTRLSEEDGTELAVIAFAVRGGAPDSPPDDL
jgi:hypothetical protein